MDGGKHRRISGSLEETMTIEKVCIKFGLACDLCRKCLYIDSEDFRDAVSTSKALGWQARKDSDYKWINVCPECLEKEEKMGKKEDYIGRIPLEDTRNTTDILLEILGNKPGIAHGPGLLTQEVIEIAIERNMLDKIAPQRMYSILHQIKRTSSKNRNVYKGSLERDVDGGYTWYPLEEESTEDHKPAPITHEELRQLHDDLKDINTFTQRIMLRIQAVLNERR